MTKLAKRLKLSKDLVEDTRLYTPEEALELIKKYKNLSMAKFNESVDLSVKLGIDPRKGDQVVKSFCTLKHGNGKSVKLIAIADGENIDKALAAGASLAGGEDLIKKIKDGFLDFNKCIATPDVMPKIAAVAKILGPRGLMPNPKLGTVTTDVAATIKEVLNGKVEFKNDKFGIVSLSIGRIAFDDQQIIENLFNVVSALKAARPSASKGKYILSATVSTTMGVGVALDTSALATS